MSSSTGESNASFHHFDEGDVVLRSCDHQDFLMYKLDLSRASPIFKATFSLPQPGKNLRLGVPLLTNGLPVVKLAESAEVLTALLALCMPIRESSRYFRSAGDVARVLEAARKYEMGWLVELAREALRELAEEEPIRVYAVACRFGLQEEVVRAAKMCLRVPVEKILACEAEELEFITSNQFRRLVKYRDDCHKAAEECVQMPQLDNTCREFAIWSARGDQKNCRGYMDTHSVACKKRYGAALSRNLKLCTWEGAVRVEDALAAWLEVPADICSGYCTQRSRVELTAISQRIAANVAEAISKVDTRIASDCIKQIAHRRSIGSLGRLNTCMICTRSIVVLLLPYLRARTHSTSVEKRPMRFPRTCPLWEIYED